MGWWLFQVFVKHAYGTNLSESSGYWFDKFMHHLVRLIEYDWTWAREGELSKLWIYTPFGINLKVADMDYSIFKKVIEKLDY